MAISSDTYYVIRNCKISVLHKGGTVHTLRGPLHCIPVRHGFRWNPMVPFSSVKQNSTSVVAQEGVICIPSNSSITYQYKLAFISN